MEVLRPVPKQPLGILLTKGTVPLKDNTKPSTPAGLLLIPGQEGNPLLLQIVSHLVVFKVCKHGRKNCQPLGGLQGLQAWKKEFS
ncbi:hypothetical protein Taro_005059 [Colocasia esculenta]|uniref:Uncharacterized protein n=1 Tax=Colocasia esculenta TaxID=4460 RepID=A0A843TTG6_COLES|nr:hypothetical protein [Colocasia esculenta]